MTDEQCKLMPILLIYMEAMECVLCKDGDFNKMKPLQNNAYELIKKEFPEWTEEQIDWIRDNPHDVYAQITRTRPFYPWIAGMSKTDFDKKAINGLFGI